MDWKKLLSEKRTREVLGGKPSSKSSDDLRTEFERDLFPLESLDGIRTRLTHSLEVSTVARDLCALRNRIQPDVERTSNAGQNGPDRLDSEGLAPTQIKGRKMCVIVMERNICRLFVEHPILWRPPRTNPHGIRFAVSRLFDRISH